MPLFRDSLKARFIFLIVAIVTLSSFLFAMALVTLKNRLEEATIGNMVRDQLAVILDTGHNHSDIELLSDWDFYGADDLALLPDSIRSLPQGSHHSVRVEDRYYQVEVAEASGEPVYLTYDISEWEDQEHALLRWLGYGMVAVLGVAILLAWLATRAGLQPLYALTARLAAIKPDERQVQIAADFEGHEVGLIASEFDRYQKRLDDFVDREKFFSAAASHELRTPLSVVMGAVDVIEAQLDNPGDNKALQRIRRACQEMLAFIEATLFLSRQDYQFNDAGGQCDVESIVRESLAENAAQLQAQQIEIEYHPSGPLLLDARPGIVKMVVSNILKNAIEHTRGGTIAIAHGDHAISICDSGEGIPEADIGRVFERSFTSKPGGTGLGLTLVKKICDRLNWQIEISSNNAKDKEKEKEKGTRVTVNFARSWGH